MRYTVGGHTVIIFPQTCNKSVDITYIGREIICRQIVIQKHVVVITILLNGIVQLSIHQPVLPDQIRGPHIRCCRHIEIIDLSRHRNLDCSIRYLDGTDSRIFTGLCALRNSKIDPDSLILIGTRAIFSCLLIIFHRNHSIRIITGWKAGETLGCIDIALGIHGGSRSGNLRP